MLYIQINNCSIAQHKADIDTYTHVINSCIKQAMCTFIPQRQFSINKYSIAGWSDLVADKHEAARQGFSS